MATGINRVTVGNDFTLKVKVGLVQYDNNDINWTYMDLSKCKDIKFNISCTPHNVDIDLDYEIDKDDSSIISALVKAEYLHKNSIYNFSITGLDAAGYRWTYISPRAQSFVTTDSSQDSYGHYTELSFTAGMIMPLAPAGQDGFTPYIGENGNWFINGQDTGHSSTGEVDLSEYSTTVEIENMLDSYYTKNETDTKIQEAVDDIDLTGYATENYVDNAINNIDLPEVSGNTINYIKSNIYDFNGEGYYLDEYGNISSRIDNYTRHYIFDTGVELTNDIEFEIITSTDVSLPGVWYHWSYRILNVGNIDTDNRVLCLGYEGFSNSNFNMEVYANDITICGLRSSMNNDIDSVHVIKISMNTASIDGEVQWNNDGSVNWEDEISRKDLDDKTIKFLPSTGQYYVYGLKIWKNGVLIKDYVPIKTDNGDGFHENVGNTDIVSQEMIFGSRDTNVFLKNAVYTKIGQKYNDSLGYTETRISQLSPVDCTSTINEILADTSPTTNITRWDQVTPLWEVSHNAVHHYHGRGRYYDCDIDAYLDKDETTQHNIATYRLWHPIEKRYYTITISYDYNDERGNLISCTYNPELAFVSISQNDYDTLLNNGQIDQNTVYIIR